MNILSSAVEAEVEQTLVEQGIIGTEELHDLKLEALSAQQPIISYLLDKKKLTDEQLTKALAKVSNLPYADLTQMHIDTKILTYLPQDVAEHYMAVPIGEIQGRVMIAMLDADNVQAIDFLSNKIGKPVKVYAASEAGIRHVIAQYGSLTLEHGLTSMLNDADQAKTEAEAEANEKNHPVTKAEQEVQTLVQDSPISKALSAILTYAVKNFASDVHIESLEKELKIRCRVDGVLREIMKLPKSAEPPMVSRVKILANLKIDEHRVPQDGQFTIKVDNRPVDIRVAISPVVWGEQVILRLLDKTGNSMQLEDMGYIGRVLRTIRRSLTLPHGMVLTSGPTGSGKTSSMYAMIQEIKNNAINIVTLEDPVEYKMEGVNQIQVNPAVGLTFATGLRSILRQDPDVIMVGEIRDKETAQLAVQAALTGHLVFSTLHTNSAAGILPRLLDMGIEPFLISSTVHTVIGQRLVRRVVPGGQMYASNKAETVSIKETVGSLLPKTAADVEKVGPDLGYLNLPLANQNAYTLVKGKATPDNPTGYKGRMGLYEAFEITEKIQDLILKHAPTSIIQQAAQSDGMVTMKQDGYFKALAGMTTLAEVNRVAAAEG